MICPNCEDLPLKELTTASGKLETCEKCSILFVPWGMLARLSSDPAKFFESINALLSFRMPTGRECPRCEKPMQQGRMPETGVFLTVCDICHSVLTDFETLGRQDAALARALAAEMKAPPPLLPPPELSAKESADASRDSAWAQRLTEEIRKVRETFEKMLNETRRTNADLEQRCRDQETQLHELRSRLEMAGRQWKDLNASVERREKEIEQRYTQAVQQTPKPVDIEGKDKIASTVADYQQRLDMQTAKSEALSKKSADQEKLIRDLNQRLVDVEKQQAAPAPIPELPKAEPPPIAEPSTPKKSFPIPAPLEPVGPVTPPKISPPVEPAINKPEQPKTTPAPQPTTPPVPRPTPTPVPLKPIKAPIPIPFSGPPKLSFFKRLLTQFKAAWTPVPRKPKPAVAPPTSKPVPMTPPIKSSPVEPPKPVVEPIKARPTIATPKPAPQPVKEQPPASLKPPVPEPVQPPIPVVAPQPVEPIKPATPAPVAMPLAKEPIKIPKKAGKRDWMGRIAVWSPRVLPLLIFLWVYAVSLEGPMYAVAWAMIVAGICLMVRLKRMYPSKRYQDQTIIQLSAIGDIGVLRGIPVSLKGHLLPVDKANRELRFEDETGTIFLSRLGGLEIWPHILGLASAHPFPKGDFTLKGWYRVAKVPFIEPAEARDEKRSRSSYVRGARWTTAILLVLFGIIFLFSME